MKEKIKTIGIVKLLELSMDNTSIILELIERVKIRTKIDTISDKVRKQNEELEDSKINGIKDLLALYIVNRKEKDLKELEKELDQYIEFISEKRYQEEYYEQLDDCDREELSKYLDKKIEYCRNNSERIETRIIENKIS